VPLQVLLEITKGEYMSDQVLIVDADIPIFRSAAKAQSTMVIGGVAMSCAQLAEQEYLLDGYIEMLKDKSGIEDVVMAVTCREGNFRKEVYPDYKATRNYTPKPVGYWQLLEYVEEQYGTISKRFLEADDVLGILGSQGVYKGKEVVTISDDKDLLTIPGKYLDTKDGFKIKTISHIEADRFFFMQAVAGDATDNYKGCPGIGMKRAGLLLDKADDSWNGEFEVDRLRLWWDAIVAAFEKAGLGEEEAILNAQMARILRVTDWDKNKQEVILWKPDF
jgi:Autographiviridae exonuclease